MKKTSLGLGSFSFVLAITGCAADVDDGATTARVRVAHLSPDAPPVDFCIAEAGTGAFVGPVLAGAGGLAGISYGHVTKYLDVAPAQYDVRLVAPAAADCSASLGGLPDFTNLPALPAGAVATIAATGKVSHGSAPFELRAYLDDAELDADNAKLRFIHASPGTPNVDVGIGGGVAFTPVFANIPFGGLQAHDDGYVTTPPLADLEISARATGTTADVISVKPVKLGGGTITTAFAIGEIGNATAPLRVLVCNDSAAPHQIETECAITGGTPERAKVRIAHLSPDAPAVDVCIATAGSPFTTPLFASLGARVGLAYPQVTEYVELPIASYDVRVILATETTCANPAVADTKGIALAKDLTATVAAIGIVDPSGEAIANPRFRLAVFADSVDVAANKTKIRFIHASPGTGNVDVGIQTAHGFAKLFGNVEFGKFAVHGGVDAIGYVEADPLTATVSARLANATTDALTIPNVTLGAGQLATAFAIGAKTGQTANPLRVLLCADSTRTQALLAKCAVAPAQ
jgi:hypothetical protein